MIILFVREWRRRRASRRRIKALVQHGVTLRNYREDRMSPDDRERLERSLAEARTLLRSRGPSADALESTSEALDAVLMALTPRRRFASLRENYEVLLVALSVAMAFRAYFFQPFKIPTGSMQPTLYGIHSAARSEPGRWDRLPLQPLKWIWTGARYRSVVIKAEGDLIPFADVDPRHRPPDRPGFSGYIVAGRRYYVPSDADVGPPRRRMRRGEVLWAGRVYSGDHVFVNRMAWNFSRPARGDVMVFSTDNIPDLQPGTHYIKRLCGMPGETLSIEPPWLMIDGAPVLDSPRIARIARREQLAPWAEPYAGYQVIGRRPERLVHPAPLIGETDSVPLTETQYFALGDNTRNSLDSRYFGPVPAANLVGPAVLVYWPFQSPRWGRMR